MYLRRSACPPRIRGPSGRERSPLPNPTPHSENRRVFLQPYILVTVSMPPPRSSRIRGTAGRALSDPPGFLVACAYILGKLKTEAYTRSFGIKINRMVRAALQGTFAVVAVVSGAAGACNPKLGARVLLRVLRRSAATRSRRRPSSASTRRTTRSSCRLDQAGTPSALVRRTAAQPYPAAHVAQPSRAKRTITIDASTTYRLCAASATRSPTLQPYTLPLRPRKPRTCSSNNTGGNWCGVLGGPRAHRQHGLLAGPMDLRRRPSGHEAERFSIAHDEKLKIPLLQRALKRAGSLKLLRRAGLPPDDCHEQHSNNPSFLGGPAGPMAHAYAAYLVKFFEAYKSEHGVDFWAVTAGNGRRGIRASGRTSSSPRPSSVTSSRFSALRYAAQRHAAS